MDGQPAGDAAPLLGAVPAAVEGVDRVQELRLIAMLAWVAGAFAGQLPAAERDECFGQLRALEWASHGQ